jgi:hypothetical protein
VTDSRWSRGRPAATKLSRMAGSRNVRYQANQEQNEEDEEANSGNLGCGESYNSETEQAGYQCDYEEDQRVVQHVETLSLTGF